MPIFPRTMHPSTRSCRSGRSIAVQLGALLLLVIGTSCTARFARIQYQPQEALGDRSGAALETRNRLMSVRQPRPSAIVYQVEDAAKDLHALFYYMESIHPNHLWNFPSTERYDQFKNKAMTWLKSLSPDGTISDIDLALIFYYSIAAFGDGHSSMHLHGNREDMLYRSANWPPFVLAIQDGEYQIAAVDSQIAELLPSGSVITSIEGQPVREFLAPVFLAISAENQVWRDYVFTRRQNFFYSLLDLFGDRKSLRIGLSDEREVSVSCVSPQIYAALYERERSQAATQADLSDYWSEAEPGIVYFSYASFRMDKDALQRIDQVFQFAAEKQARHLIIDLRRNGGGNSGAGDYMIDYFYTGKYWQFRKVVARYSQAVLDREGFTAPMIGAAPGSLVVYEGSTSKAAGRKPFFFGRIHVITGPGTFSSASDFAATVQDFAMGELWGYETGGVRSCHGDVFSATLPGTGWPLGISWKTFYAPVERPDEMSRGVLPDHPASSELLTPYSDKSDPLLAWILAELTARN